MFDRIGFRLRALVQSSALEREMHDDARRTRWIESVRTDIRFALRSFARKPFLSATIVLVLALGIGAHALELTMLHGFTTRRPGGIPGDVELVRLRGMWRPKDQPTWSPLRFSYPEVREMAEVPNTFVSVVAWTTHDVVVDAPGSLDRAKGEANFVTDGFFAVLGLHPAHGAGLPAGRQDPQFVAVISHAMWEDVFARAEDVASRTIVVNGVVVRIVGVAPRHFVDPIGGGGRRILWMPLSARAVLLSAGQTNSVSIPALSSVDSTLFEAVGVLRRGVSPAEATARVRVVARRAVARMTWPAMAIAAGSVYDADVVPLRGVTKVQPNDMAGLTAILGVITTLVLLVACTNVSGLVVSAGAIRRQEIAIRLSLGASRVRVIQQLLTESVLLAIAGGAVGLLVYGWIISGFMKRQPDLAWLSPDFTVVAFTMCIALATGVLCGLMPAFHATRQDVAETLKGDAMGATPRSRLQHAFVVAQVTFTQPLLVLVGALIATLLLSVPPTLPNGTPERLLSVVIGAVPGTPAERTAALQRVERRIAELPGVVRVLGDFDARQWATLSVHPDDRGTLPRASMPVPVDIQLVRPGYFSILDAPLVRGNDRPPTDTSGIMTISSDLARELWGNVDPIGRRFVQTSPSIGVNRIFTVTGVYDTRYLFNGGNRARVYRLAATWWLSGGYLIRTVGNAADITAAVRRVVREELPLTPIESIWTRAQLDAEGMKEIRQIQAGAIASGAVVLVLASLGLYGVVALAVAQRRREIGVRMALGARAVEVVQLFYVRGVKLGVVGLALGLPATLVVMRVIESSTRSLASQQSPSVLLVGGIVAAVVLLVASIATLLPATRAARVDPVTALRSQ